MHESINGATITIPGTNTGSEKHYNNAAGGTLPIIGKNATGINNMLNNQHQVKILGITAVTVILCMFLVNEVLPALSPESSLHVSSGTKSSIRDFVVARRESYGFFEDIPSSHWALMKQRVRERQNHNDRKHGQRSKIIFLDQPEAWYQNNWEPDFTCQHERKVGGMGTGAKWICDPHRIPRASKQRVIADSNSNNNNGCLIYSFGAMGDLKLEYGLRETLGPATCEIHIFDNSRHFQSYKDAPNLTDDYHNVHFHPWSLEGSEKPTDSRRFMTLQETVEHLGHSKRVIDVFRLKCADGCEWTTYNDWFKSDVVIMQILVEVHNSPRAVANDFFETMQKWNYVTFHKEPNTHFCAGKCQNYSFLKLAPEFFTS